MKRPSYYHIEVAPLVVLPLSRPSLYSYQSREDIPLGSWVRIPFGSREIDGVAYASRRVLSRPPAWMKAVVQTVEPAFLTPLQRELAELVSSEYFAPLGRTLRHFLPVRAASKKKKEGSPRALLPPLKESSEEKNFLAAYRALPPARSAAYNPSFFQEPERLLVHLAKRTARSKKQILILVPEITLFPGLIETLSAFFPKEALAVLHSKLPKSAYFAAWESIRTGQAQVVIATRQGLFAPFANVGLIVVTEEEDESYKQWDMSPRYDAKRVASLLSHLTGARVLYSSVTPSLETVHAVNIHELETLTPLLSERPLNTALSLVNLKLERFQKNFSALSRPLRDRIRETLADHKQVLLYVERQGTSAFSICTQCKNIYRCPRCGRALASTSQGYFQCPSCHYRTALFPGCPICRNLTFRHIGYGTARIEREVAKLFPRAKIARADASSMKSYKAIEKLYQEGNAETDILIGTQMILNAPPLPRLGLTAIIDADSLLSRPDFRADERYFHLLIRAAHQIECRKDGVLIQTFHPESTLNQRIIQLSPKHIYDGMLSERQDTGYPPFLRAILLSGQFRTSEEAAKSQEGTREALEKILEKLSGRLVVLTEEPKFLKKEKAYLVALALRVPDGDMLPPALTTYLRSLSPLYRVDVDPLSLFV